MLRDRGVAGLVKLHRGTGGRFERPDWAASVPSSRAAILAGILLLHQ